MSTSVTKSKLISKITSQITLLAEQNDLKLRQRFMVSYNESHAKNRGCVSSMLIDRSCKRIIMSGVGAHYRNVVGKIQMPRTRCFYQSIFKNAKKMEGDQWNIQ